jgi:hypothetical protein
MLRFTVEGKSLFVGSRPGMVIVCGACRGGIPMQSWSWGLTLCDKLYGESLNMVLDQHDFEYPRLQHIWFSKITVNIWAHVAT